MVKISIIFLSLYLFTVCNAQDSNRLIVYKNMSYSIDSFDIASLECDKQSVLSLNELDLRNIKCRKKLNENLKRWFLHQDLISKWDKYQVDPYNIYPDNYKEFISVREQELDLYSIGRIKISTHFSSYGILIEENYNNSEFSNNEFINRRLVIVNVNNQEVTSLFEGFGYSVLSGHARSKTIIRLKGKYFYFFYFHSPLLKEQLIEKMNKEEVEFCSFKIDRCGRLKDVL